MRKDDSVLQECFALPYKLGVKSRIGEMRVRDPMMKDDNAEFGRLLSHTS
jgi:hypothetical protein